MKQYLTSQLSKQPEWVFALFASLTAFLTYSCMYAFRKPFTVGLYEGMDFAGVSYKIWLISAQVVGYTLSKFAGIKYIAEMKTGRRATFILCLVAIAEVALLLFWMIPRPYNIFCMFLNGLPLGMIWGVVFSYLEGRRLTELLGAALSVSFILASGVVKSVGQWVLTSLHVSEFGMPFLTGLLFALPLVASVFLLDCLPAPTVADERLRTKRLPMDKAARKAFVLQFRTGLVLLVATYVFLTIFRDMRDNFSAELWRAIGYADNPAIFTLTELPVALFTLLVLAFVTFIRSNIHAFRLILAIILCGFLLVLVATLLFSNGRLSGEWWMILIGTGLYLGYIPFNAFLYERLISSFRYVSNVGFIIYVSDAFGYLGSLGVVFYKNFFDAKLSWLSFFVKGGLIASAAGMLLAVLALFYFNQKYNLYITKTTNEYERFTRKSLFTAHPGATLDQ